VGRSFLCLDEIYFYFPMTASLPRTLRPRSASFVPYICGYGFDYAVWSAILLRAAPDHLFLRQTPEAIRFFFPRQGPQDVRSIWYSSPRAICRRAISQIARRSQKICEFYCQPFFFLFHSLEGKFAYPALLRIAMIGGLVHPRLDISAPTSQTPPSNLHLESVHPVVVVLLFLENQISFFSPFSSVLGHTPLFNSPRKPFSAATS